MARIDEILSTQHLLVKVGDAAQCRDLQEKLDKLTEFVTKQYEVDSLSHQIDAMSIDPAPPAEPIDPTAALKRKQFEAAREESKDVLKWCDLRHPATQQLLRQQDQALKAILEQGEQNAAAILDTQNLVSKLKAHNTVLLSITADHHRGLAKVHEQTAQRMEDEARTTLASSSSASGGPSPSKRPRADSDDSGMSLSPSGSPEPCYDSDDSGCPFEPSKRFIVVNTSLVDRPPTWSAKVMKNKNDINNTLQTLFELRDKSSNLVEGKPKTPELVEVVGTHLAELVFKMDFPESNQRTKALVDRYGGASFPFCQG